MNPNKTFKSLLLMIFGILLLRPGQAQVIDNENKVNVILSDGVNVTLYGAASTLSDEKSKEYYYMPTKLRLSKKADGTPMFLFLKYTTEDPRGDESNGAILHMLMEYGLTREQERELGNKLKRQVKGAVLKGVVDVDPAEENSIQIVSATLNNKKRVRTLVHSGKAPKFPGNKIAVAAELDKNAAQLMDATFKETSSIADLSITLAYDYHVRVPAVKGYIIEDWSKLDSLHLLDSAYYSKEVKKEKDYGEKAINGVVGGIVGGPIGAAIGWFGSGNKKTTKRTYDEMRNFYRFMEEKGVIEMRLEENIDDARIQTIRDAFFQHFLNSFTERVSEEVPSPGKQEKVAMPNIKIGNEYKFRREFVEMIVEKRRREFNLSYAFAVKKSFQMTENLASWYDGVKHNPKCVGEVVLNDPFFQHRQVNMILDLDAEDMMGKELNYVTVNVRKSRKLQGGNDFEEAITFDRSFFANNGNRAELVYSKAKSDKPSEYEYKVQWSLRGGNIWPTPKEDTSWQKGSWQAISLSPPVEPRFIRYEVDLDELQELDLRNATLQLRYQKFGREVETNLNISLYSKEPYKEKTIYMDKGTQGYAYRLVFTHKRKGVMAMPWEAKINTDYIFAVVPQELYNNDETFIEQALEAGKTILRAARGDQEVDEKDAILDKFADVLKTD
ncbi:MAG: hypothetical protein MRZ79_21490 [Bacteroidia bacterium]|nr:hypothetical protein [Bacteroidia bacterium]